MHEITIVKRRSHIWPIVLIMILLAILVLGALWFVGDAAYPDFNIGRHVLVVPSLYFDA